MNLTYEERRALTVIRKALVRKPEIAGELLKGLSREMAVKVLLQARDELAQLLEVNRAFVKAAGDLAAKEQPTQPI